MVTCDFMLQHAQGKCVLWNYVKCMIADRICLLSGRLHWGDRLVVWTLTAKLGGKRHSLLLTSLTTKPESNKIV